MANPIQNAEPTTAGSQSGINFKGVLHDVISYESAVFYATSPAELTLRVQGVSGTSDMSWAGFEEENR
jgi:hypothetical protein